jgi:hypothetical protein
MRLPPLIGCVVKQNTVELAGLNRRGSGLSVSERAVRNQCTIGTDRVSIFWNKAPAFAQGAVGNCGDHGVTINGTLFVTGTAGVTALIPKDISENILYLLGVLNSRLLSFYVVHHSPVFQGGYYKFSAPYLKLLPIRRIDFTNAADKAAHDRMVKFLDTMLQLHPRLAAAQAAHDRDLIQRQIDATDQQIDALVYQLYGLTEEEIKIVEGQM